MGGIGDGLIPQCTLRNIHNKDYELLSSTDFIFWIFFYFTLLQCIPLFSLPPNEFFFILFSFIFHFIFLLSTNFLLIFLFILFTCAFHWFLSFLHFFLDFRFFFHLIDTFVLWFSFSFHCHHTTNFPLTFLQQQQQKQ